MAKHGIKDFNLFFSFFFSFFFITQLRYLDITVQLVELVTVTNMPQVTYELYPHYVVSSIPRHEEDSNSQL